MPPALIPVLIFISLHLFSFLSFFRFFSALLLHVSFKTDPIGCITCLVSVHGCRFTVFSMNYATIEAFWILISTLELILSHLNQFVGWVERLRNPTKQCWSIPCSLPQTKYRHWPPARIVGFRASTQPTRLLFTPASSRIRILFAEPVLGLGAPSFNTCFNLHFTSPPSLFKLVPGYWSSLPGRPQAEWCATVSVHGRKVYCVQSYTGVKHFPFCFHNARSSA